MEKGAVKAAIDMLHTRKVLEEYGPLPDFTDFLINRIMEYKWMPRKPNHLLVNEYNPGQGIMPHVGKCQRIIAACMNTALIPSPYG